MIQWEEGKWYQHAKFHMARDRPYLLFVEEMRTGAWVVKVRVMPINESFPVAVSAAPDLESAKAEAERLLAEVKVGMASRIEKLPET